MRLGGKLARRCRHHETTYRPFGRSVLIATTPKQWRKLRKDHDVWDALHCKDCGGTTAVR